MLTISHRGYCRDAVENTLESFERARAIGVDGIETDVRQTSDGRVILHHDRRIADGRAVCDLSYRELCEQVGFDVPTLEAALRWTDELLWVLEIKDARVTDSLIKEIKPFRRSHRLLIISFLHNVMTRVQEEIKVDCGVTVTHRPVDFQTSQLARWSTIVWRYEFVDPALIQQSKAGGRQNLAYHVFGLEEHRRCFELGLDGVITDEPDVALAAQRAPHLDLAIPPAENAATPPLQADANN